MQRAQMRTIKLLNMDAIGAGPVIRRKQLAEIQIASSIIEETERWAEQQRATLDAEIEEGRRHAFATAYSEWLQEHADALNYYDAKVKALEDRVLGIVRSCLNRILSELPTDEVLRGLVAPVLADLKSSGEIMIMVHPDAILAGQMMCSAVQGDLPADVTLVVRGDASLGPEDCLVYTDDEVFNVSIPVTCELFCRALRGTLKNEVCDVA